MHCQLTLLRLEEYLDGALGLIARQEVERHLSGCQSCADQHLEMALLREARTDGVMSLEETGGMGREGETLA